MAQLMDEIHEHRSRDVYERLAQSRRFHPVDAYFYMFLGCAVVMLLYGVWKAARAYGL
jgi:hypothetical protein